MGTVVERQHDAVDAESPRDAERAAQGRHVRRETGPAPQNRGAEGQALQAGTFAVASTADAAEGSAAKVSLRSERGCSSASCSAVSSSDRVVATRAIPKR